VTIESAAEIIYFVRQPYCIFSTLAITKYFRLPIYFENDIFNFDLENKPRKSKLAVAPAHKNFDYILINIYSE